MTAALVSIIGAPGAGKTTLAELLAGRLGASILHEDYEGNPFLAGSYLGRVECCLPAQAYYLMTRARQMSAADWPRDGLVVSDYGYCQDRIYARAKLTGEDLAAYEQIAGRIDGLVVSPQVTVYLQASLELLRQRIAQRGRDFERAFGDDLLIYLDRAYHRLATEAEGEWITIPCDEVDFRRANVLAELESDILGRLDRRGA
ncbi:MAG: deoxynucleoside kinase [Phycisphaerae bacterium]